MGLGTIYKKNNLELKHKYLSHNDGYAGHKSHPNTKRMLQHKLRRKISKISDEELENED